MMKTKLILFPFSFPCHSFCHLLEMPVMKVGSVSGGKITLYYCTGNR